MADAIVPAGHAMTTGGEIAPVGYVEVGDLMALQLGQGRAVAIAPVPERPRDVPIFTAAQLAAAYAEGLEDAAKTIKGEHPEAFYYTAESVEESLEAAADAIRALSNKHKGET